MTRCRWTALVAAGCLTAVAAGLSLTVSRSNGHSQVSITTAVANSKMAVGGVDREAPVAAGTCPPVPTEADGAVTGNSAGGTDSGPDAVMAFETAYYVARSGTAARAVTAPDAVVPSAATIQAGIDTVPVGSGFCVRVFPESGGRWPVDLTEYRPGLAPVVYRQSVTTASVDGRILIAGVTAR